MSKSQQIPQIISKSQKPAESPQKRRGRPEKKGNQVIIPDHDCQELFSMHDNVFHASILFYTFRIFDKAPTRTKFNPTIGFSIYEKVKNIPEERRKYYEDDKVAMKHSQPWKENFALSRFFINSMTFGPKCVIDQFYALFAFILNEQPDIIAALSFVAKSQFRYMVFNCSVMDTLDVKTQEIREKLAMVIEVELVKLVEIIIHTVLALKKGEKENKFTSILETQEDLFERGVNSKPKKKVKVEGA